MSEGSQSFHSCVLRGASVTTLPKALDAQRFVFPACACMLSRFGHVRLFAAPGTIAHQAPLSTEFSRQY